MREGEFLLSDLKADTLRLILGDQLNGRHSWFRAPDEHVLYVMMELRQETVYVRHHIQKVLAFFAAMRAFAHELRQDGHRLHYVTLDDASNSGHLTENLLQLIRRWRIKRFEYLLPDEFRLDQQLRRFCESLPIETSAVDTEHFLSSRESVQEYFGGKQHYRMESFYRTMRRRTAVLMQGDQPMGGRWNFDIENRHRYDGAAPVPAPLCFENDVSHLRELLEQEKISTMGETGDRLIWPINRQQSLALLDYFIDVSLPYFGTFQDAMKQDQWSLFHSRLSFSLNTKMLHPMEVIDRATAAWAQHQETITLPQVEGFVRQILGWREYMRGVYWARMPELARMNFFEHRRPLPHYYWDGRTKMNCLKRVIEQSLHKAYAHHIQRLMVTGNFALLAGIDPDALDAWYLGIYIDAIEWVEITNTRGMSQFADGGLIASKPYVSSANYIHKMSDYCQNCHYDRNAKFGERACPFNSLYWHFYDRHRPKLAKNPRIGMLYRTWDRMADSARQAIRQQAEQYLQDIERL
ncbi:cryptochrome/photolyase family protein [candidate division KSB1 bacterium]|nr:cryptochrome/photolyase family protein [candidate division KSB1 bacterium]